MFIIYTNDSIENIKILSESEAKIRHPRRKHLHYKELKKRFIWEVCISGFHSIDEVKIWIAQRTVKQHRVFIHDYDRKLLWNQSSKGMTAFYDAQYLNISGAIKKTQKFLNKMADRHPELFL